MGDADREFIFIEPEWNGRDHATMKDYGFMLWARFNSGTLFDGIKRGHECVILDAAALGDPPSESTMQSFAILAFEKGAEVPLKAARIIARSNPEHYAEIVAAYCDRRHT